MFSPVKLGQNSKAAPDVATAVREAKGPCILEPKLDGWRILAEVKQDGSVELYSRTAKRYAGCLPLIEHDLATALPPGSWVDGEVVIPGLSSNAVQSVLGSNADKAASRSEAARYVVFDLLAFEGRDWRAQPMWKRRKGLEAIFRGASGPIVLAEQLEATDENHQRLLDAGEEGSIVKDIDAPYASGKRGHGWRKLKAKWTMDVILTDLLEGTNSNAGQLGVMVFSQYKDGELVVRGKCKVLGDAVRHAITANPEQYLGRVMEIRHMGIQVDGPRHPTFLRWRDDKSPDECTYSNE